MIISKTGIVVFVIFLLGSLYLGLSGLCKLYVKSRLISLTQKRSCCKRIQLTGRLMTGPHLKTNMIISITWPSKAMRISFR